jgi:hypothetical protein
LHDGALGDGALGDDAGAGAGESAGARERAEAVPLLRGRTAGADGGPLVYLCRDMVCERPVASVPEVLERLGSGTR